MDSREFFNSRAFDWDKRCRHDVNKIKRIINLSSVTEKSRILDVGTGTGILISYLLGKNPSEIVGVDISENMISVAQSKYNDPRVRFVAKDILEYGEKGFDYIFLYCVYPHISNKKALFKHLLTLLNPEGKVIIAHSQSRREINEVHEKYAPVKNHHLLSAEKTQMQMNNYFYVDRTIDDDNFYYISGTKEKEKIILETPYHNIYSMV